MKSDVFLPFQNFATDNPEARLTKPRNTLRVLPEICWHFLETQCEKFGNTQTPGNTLQGLPKQAESAIQKRCGCPPNTLRDSPDIYGYSPNTLRGAMKPSLVTKVEEKLRKYTQGSKKSHISIPTARVCWFSPELSWVLSGPETGINSCVTDSECKTRPGCFCDMCMPKKVICGVKTDAHSVKSACSSCICLS